MSQAACIKIIICGRQNSATSSELNETLEAFASMPEPPFIDPSNPEFLELVQSIECASKYQRKAMKRLKEFVS